MRWAGFLLCAGMAAAGPWPRAPGEVFLSPSVEFVDEPGDVRVRQQIYAEIGLPRATLVASAASDGDAALSVRALLAEGAALFAVSAGGRRDTDGEDAGTVGLHIGRGLQVWGVSGWASADGALALNEDGVAERKLDVTLGLTTGRVKWIGTANLYHEDDTQISLGGGVAVRLFGEAHLQVSAAEAVVGDPKTRVGAALWIGF